MANRFIHITRAYYANSLRASWPRYQFDEINIVLEDPDCEFFVRWYRHEYVDRSVSVRLEMFDDAWRALTEIPELCELFADKDSTRRDEPLFPDEFCAELVDMGFEDATPTEWPKE